MVEKLQEKIEKVKEAVKRCGLDSECVGCPYENQHCSELDRDIITVIDCLEAKVPRWISVKERLPEKHRRVLGVCCMGVFEMWHDGKYWRIDELPFEDTVTHWMPLPEPPAEE